MPRPTCRSSTKEPSRSSTRHTEHRAPRGSSGRSRATSLREDPVLVQNRDVESVIVVCGLCGNVLTNAVRQLDQMPAPTRAGHEDERYLPTIPVGAWAADPEPIGRRDGRPTSTLGCLVINPADAIGVLSSGDPRRNSGCCGHDGLDGPNLLCRGCRSEVATLRDDCWSEVEIRFEPAAVAIRPAGHL
jgi:hypothetical protein